MALRQDSNIPWITDENGRPMGYIGDDHVEYALDGSPIDKSGISPMPSGLTLDPTAGLLIGGADLTYAQRAAVQRGMGGPLRTPAQVLTAAAADAPTITDMATATSSIASGVRITKDNGCFDYLGPSLGTWSANSAFNAPTTAGIGGLANTVAVTFCTDSPLFELYMVRYNSKIFVEVDGVPALSNQIALDASGAANLISVDFSGVRKARTIRVSGYNMPFGGLYIGPTDSVWRASDDRQLITFAGDSYTFGTGANAQALGWAATAARILDLQYWIDGIGGTGYNSATPNTLPERAANRHALLVRRNAGINTTTVPDKMVWALGYNDGPVSSPAAGSIEAAFDAAHASFSKTPDVVIGPWTPVGSNAALRNTRDRLALKAAAVGAVFINIDDWINTENDGVLTGGDNVHPTQVGHDYLGFRIAQAMRASGI